MEWVEEVYKRAICKDSLMTNLGMGNKKGNKSRSSQQQQQWMIQARVGGLHSAHNEASETEGICL